MGRHKAWQSWYCLLPVPNSNNWFILDQFWKEDSEQDSSDDNDGDDDNAEAGVLEMSREEYMAYFT